MNRKDLFKALAEKTGMSQKDCETVYNAFLETVYEEINVETESKTIIPGIGTIKVTLVEAHESKNPRTGESVDVPDKRQARMSLSDTIKGKLVQPSDKKAKKACITWEDNDMDSSEDSENEVVNLSMMAKNY